MTVTSIQKKYRNKLASLDLDLLIGHAIKKEREFVLAHPEHKLSMKQEIRIKNYVQRRLKNEPLAYILREKEFYGLNFKVTPHALIPRPETELMVEMGLEFMKTKKHASIKVLKQKNNKTFSTHVISHQSSVINIIDVGTGSGNIVISLARTLANFKFEILNLKFFGTDISKEALKIAKQNAKLHNVHKEIKFLHGNLLSPIIKNSKFKIQNSRTLVLANLPYLSKDIYDACTDNVKKYEPKTALYSAKCGLAHYDQLLGQIFKLRNNYSVLYPEAKLFGATILMEISPEQKKLLPPLIKKYFPKAKIEFKKDLAQKWRVCKVKIK